MVAENTRTAKVNSHVILLVQIENTLIRRTWENLKKSNLICIPMQAKYQTIKERETNLVTKVCGRNILKAILYVFFR